MVTIAAVVQIADSHGEHGLRGFLLDFLNLQLQ